MLKLLDITKEYKVDEESVLALHGVSIEFRRNEFVSILGPSGCGKTTLLNIIGGLDQYTSGDIQIDRVSTKEYDQIDWDTYRNRRIGFIFQSYNLIPHMNILKNVAMSLTLAGVPAQERKVRALEALKKVGLDSQARKKPNQLSGGQMQRVAIARALVNNPEIILADEPTGALDSESGIQVMDLLKEVAKDRLVIMVTHNPQLAEQYSTRIVYLKDGEVVDDTKPYSENDDPVAQAYFEKLEKQKLLEKENLEFEAANACKCKKNKKSDVDATANGQVADSQTAQTTKADKKIKKLSRLQLKMLRLKANDRSSMSLRTAISLSFNNLLSKKGRTLLTSIAGSIGIIGIILVLAASSGVSGYVHSIEENALSKYPITIEESSVDIQSAMNILMPKLQKTFPSGGVISINSMLGKLMEALPTISSENDLVKLKAYLDNNFDPDLGQIKYNYGTSFNVFSDYAYKNNLTADEKNKVDIQENAFNLYNGATPVGAQTEFRYEKLYPYTDVMEDIFKKVEDSFGGGGGGSALQQLLEQSKQFAYSIPSWDEISTNQKLLNNQYDLIAGAWPDQTKTTSANQLVIVVDENNKIPDYGLFMLGLISSNKVGSLMTGGSLDMTFNAEDFIGLKYKAISNADYFYQNSDDYWSGFDKKYRNKNFIESVGNYDPANGVNDFIGLPKANAMDLEIIGVVRPKQGVNVTSINGVVGYTHGLTEKIIGKAETHPAIQAQIAEFGAGENFKAVVDMKDSWSLSYKGSDKTNSVPMVAGKTYPRDFTDQSAKDKFADKNELYTVMMRVLGFADLERPKSISFYCSSFNSKDKIVALLDKYSETIEQIKYTDYLAIIMGYVGTLTNVVTYVLVGFSAISLLVSTIMIGIIIYTSVLERRKEIGVLRSLGARKKDISRVFIAESSMIGAYSGIIGTIISAIFSAIIAFVLFKVFQIPNLLMVTWWHCFLMIGISVLLSILAGYIPSRIAANKDPAIALRSE